MFLLWSVLLVLALWCAIGFLVWLFIRVMVQGTKTSTHSRLSLRARLDAYLRRTSVGRRIKVTNIILSIFAFLLYVVGTYFDEDDLPTPIIVLDVVLTCVFAWDYVLHFTAAERKLKYVFSFFGIIDLLTVVPVFLELLVESLSIRWLRVFRALRVMRAYRVFSFTKTGVQEQAFGLTFSVLSLLFVSTAIIQVVERDEEREDPVPGFDLTFHRCLYFVVVTLTTVGFGEISPLSAAGKMIMMCMIIAGIIIIPMNASRLSQMVSSISRYGKRYVPSSDYSHVIVCGSITRSSLDAFFREFFHKELIFVDKVKAVVVSPVRPSFEVKKLLEDPLYEQRVQYIQGSPMELKDLYRAEATAARAFFVMADKYSGDPDTVDADNILVAMSLWNLTTTVPTFVQLVKQENTHHLLQQAVDTITYTVPVEELKMAIMARCVECPGFCSFITSLLSTYSIPAVVSDENEELHQHWIHEYLLGVSNEIYATEFADSFVGKTFSDVAVTVYTQLEVLLLAVETVDATGTPVIRLFPGVHHVINEGDIALVIARDEAAADRVNDFDDLLARRESSFVRRETNAQVSPILHPPSLDSSFFCGSMPSDADSSWGLGTHAPLYESSISSALVDETVSNDVEESGSCAPSDGATTDPPSGPGVSPLDASGAVLAQEEQQQRQQQQQQQQPKPHQHTHVTKTVPAKPVRSPHRLAPDSTSILRQHRHATALNTRSRRGSLFLMPGVMQRRGSLPLSDSLDHHIRPSFSDMKHHVVVCGIPSSLEHFVNAVQSSRRIARSIVIMNPTPPSEDTWSKMNSHHGVYYLKGTSLSVPDLLNAGVMGAKQVVLFAQSRDEQRDEFMVDARTIFAVRSFLLCPDISGSEFVAELVHGSNTKFFHSVGQFADDQFSVLRHHSFSDASDFHLTPIFASGRIFTASSMDALMNKLFRIPQTLAILRMLCGICENKSTADSGPQVFQMNIPQAFTSKGVSFSNVFQFLVERDILPIALYRYSPGSSSTPTNKKQRPFFYVYTNPRPDTPVGTKDRLIVLAREDV